MSQTHESFTIRIVRKFLESTCRWCSSSCRLRWDAGSARLQPREGEPQILVPGERPGLLPGRSAHEVEQWRTSSAIDMMMKTSDKFDSRNLRTMRMVKDSCVWLMRLPQKQHRKCCPQRDHPENVNL